MVLPQPGQVLQIPAPQAITANIVTLPTLKQNVPVPAAAAPPLTFCSSFADDDVSRYSSHKQGYLSNV